MFSDCVSSCPPSCASHHPLGSAVAVEQCRKECVGGCECPPGLYSHRGLCLKREECPCFHRRRSYKAGESIQQKCNIWYKNQTNVLVWMFPVIFQFKYHMFFQRQCVPSGSVGVYWRKVCWPVRLSWGTSGDYL